MTFTHALSTNNYGSAKFIVDASAANGTHTTIGAALTSATSGDTIFIRPGTYTENLSLKAGVNLSAYPADGYTPNVIILGKCTATFAGTCSISGIQLKTNSDFCLAVTGSSATFVNLKSCFIDANNSTAISFTTSSGSAKIQLYDCRGNIDTTGISYFTHSSAGALKFFGGTFENDGASTTAATCSGSGGLNFYNCYFGAPVTTSSTSALSMNNVQFQAPLIVNGTGSNFISNSTIISGSSSAISVGTGATLTFTESDVDSSNTNAITGAGTLIYSGISFSNSSAKINTTTQTGGTLKGGLTQAPSAGFLGERISSGFIALTSISNTSPTSLTNISLTAGIWDISAIAYFQASGANIQAIQTAISANNNSFTGVNFGDSGFQNNPGSSQVIASAAVPAFRVTLTATTTYYLVNQAVFATGTCQHSGRISAVRVG